MSKNQGWIGVDLDGTLAFYEKWNGDAIGAPIPLMVERVRGLINDGQDVRIFTARVCSKHSEEARERARKNIEVWCEQHIGCVLPVTAEKDFQMIMLFDDRAVTVEKNTGRIMAWPLE